MQTLQPEMGFDPRRPRRLALFVRSGFPQSTVSGAIGGVFIAVRFPLKCTLSTPANRGLRLPAPAPARQAGSAAAASTTIVCSSCTSASDATILVSASMASVAAVLMTSKSDLTTYRIADLSSLACPAESGRVSSEATRLRSSSASLPTLRLVAIRICERTGHRFAIVGNHRERARVRLP